MVIIWTITIIAVSADILLYPAGIGDGFDLSKIRRREISSEIPKQMCWKMLHHQSILNGGISLCFVIIPCFCCWWCCCCLWLCHGNVMSFFFCSNRSCCRWLAFFFDDLSYASMRWSWPRDLLKFFFVIYSSIARHLVPSFSDVP